MKRSKCVALYDLHILYAAAKKICKYKIGNKLKSFSWRTHSEAAQSNMAAALSQCNSNLGMYRSTSLREYNAGHHSISCLHMDLPLITQNTNTSFISHRDRQGSDEVRHCTLHYSTQLQGGSNMTRTDFFF
jgi:copper oxidase (laccase) domain-containing protein